MRRFFPIVFACTFFITFISSTLFAGEGEIITLEQEHLSFIENKGQWKPNVKFRSVIPSGAAFLGTNEFTFVYYDKDAVDELHELSNEGKVREAELDNHLINHHAFRISFLNSNPNTQLSGKSTLSTYYNYFLGNDPGKWASAVPAFHEVIYNDLYPGIDLKVYSQGVNFKYDVNIEAGADPSLIALNYEGNDAIYLENGNLVLVNSINRLTELQPVAWQLEDGRKLPVKCDFSLQGTHVGFHFPDGFDPDLPIVIDPELVGCTYSGSGDSQYGFTCTYDEAGHIYGGGEQFGPDFPLSLGAFQTTFGGSVDMSISKFSPDATVQIFATFLGGNNSDLPHSLVVNAAEELYIYGSTRSTDFPTTVGAYDETHNGGADIAVSRVNPDGTVLMSSTVIGGSDDDGTNTIYYNYGDGSRGEVNYDLSGNVYIGSCTNSFDFPATPGSYQTILGGMQDGCLTKLTADLSTVLWSTFLGGNEDDGVYAIKIDAGENVYAVGGTGSANFPVTPGVLGPTFLGGASSFNERDGFVAEISPDGSSLVKSTFIATDEYDQVFFIEIDEEGKIYIFGQSEGNFPVSAGVYSNPGSGMVLAKLNDDFSAYEWSTVYGSGSGTDISPTAFLVDICGNIYTSGFGSFFSSGSMPITSDAFKPSTSSQDFHLMVLTENATSLLYATFFGGSGSEHVDGGTSRFDKQGVIYQGVCTSSSDFPVTPGAAHPLNMSSWNLGMFKFDFEFAGVNAIPGVYAAEVIGCVPFSVGFQNLSSGASSYLWQFSGSAEDTATSFEPVHVFTEPGIYNVMLIASDTGSCNGSDTAFIEIIAHDDSIFADFDVFQPDSCLPSTVEFTNNSTAFGTMTYLWDFGDGNSSTLENPTHTYDETGTFTVILIVSDPLACNPVDTAIQELIVAPSIVADISGILNGCAPHIVNLTTTELIPGQSYQWDFGNGTTSTEQNPEIVYTEAGDFIITLISSSANTCNGSDTISAPISVWPEVTAAFTTTPEIPAAQDIIFFTNNSINADSASWTFGDGGVSNEINPTYTYSIPNVYEVCLYATNEFGCEDEICADFLIDVRSQVYIPNAFTPNGDGNNDVFSIIQEEVKSLITFKIFNRWGEMIFETSNLNDGWNGTYKDKEQEIGTYIYFIELLNQDDQKILLKGNITLIR